MPLGIDLELQSDFDRRQLQDLGQLLAGLFENTFSKRSKTLRSLSDRL
jgi:hypothetical protein